MYRNSAQITYFHILNHLRCNAAFFYFIKRNWFCCKECGNTFDWVSDCVSGCLSKYRQSQKTQMKASNKSRLSVLRRRACDARDSDSPSKPLFILHLWHFLRRIFVKIVIAFSLQHFTFESYENLTIAFSLLLYTIDLTRFYLPNNHWS